MVVRERQKAFSACRFCLRHMVGLLVILSFGLSACAKLSQPPEQFSSTNAATTPDESSESYIDSHGAQYALGTPSSRAATNDALFLGDNRALPYVGAGDTSYISLMAAHAALNPTHSLPIASRDTNAATQWDAGWTGKNVKVGIIDEFNDNNTIDSHGDKVSLVVNSVAPEADLLMRHSTLVSTDVEAGWVHMNNNDYHIVNNSFGRARFDPDTGAVDSSFDTDLSSWVNNRFKITGPSTYSDNMLFIFAAGNSGAHCPDKRVHICSFRAAVVHGHRAAGVRDTEAYIWVGSLTDDGTALADYSHSAGDMANDFIVAHDDVLAQGDASGTSFAAPRVAGAAALVRHKFPLLNGMELKSLLLNTATDMGTPGPDAVFGHGRLDLQNALSPQGQLTAE